FFITAPPPARSSPLSLHDALPISFDPDGTPSPGAQTALDGAVAGLATTADLAAQIGAATDGLASEEFVSDAVAAIPDADLTTPGDRKSTRLNSSHVKISYAVFCLK